MHRRAISYGTMLGILLAAVVFVIILIVIKEVLTAANYGGRWNCKFAYAIAAPLGLFSNDVAVIQQAGTWGFAGTAIAISIALAFVTHRSIKIAAGEEGKSLFSRIKDAITKNREKFMKNFRRVILNEKFLKATGYSTLASAALYGIGALSNSIAENLQRPILDGLCKPEAMGYLDTQYLDNTKCMEEISKEVYDSNTFKFLKGLDKDSSKEACVLYHIAKMVINTYGETIGASVRTGYGKLHYVMIVRYTVNKPIYLSDLIAMLGILKAKKDLSFYDLIYGKGAVAYAKDEGAFYQEAEKSKVINIQISSEGEPKILTALIDATGNEVNIIGDEHTVIFNGKGLYNVEVFYDGQGSIIISAVKVE